MNNKLENNTPDINIDGDLMHSCSSDIYVIKIDKRKKSSLNDAILECIARNELYCNETEDGYVEKKHAKKFKSYESAFNSITENWEMVCRI